MIVYRGKYPNRVESIWSMPKPARGLMCRTNSGAIYHLKREGLKLGDDITIMGEVVGATYVTQSEKRRAAK